MRVISWNSRGNNDYYYGILLRTFNPHILCLQECGNIQTGIPNEEVNVTLISNLLHFAKRFGSVDCEVFYWPVDASNSRCSMAMILPLNNGRKTSAAYKSWSVRPAMTLKIGRIWITNIHAVASAGAAANSQNFITRLTQKGYNGLCVGDFNCTPAQLSARGINATNFVRPHVPTHFGQGANRELDYGYLIRHTHNGAQATRHGNNYGSDHFPVIFDIM